MLTGGNLLGTAARTAQDLASRWTADPFFCTIPKPKKKPPPARSNKAALNSTPCRTPKHGGRKPRISPQYGSQQNPPPKKKPCCNCYKSPQIVTPTPTPHTHPRGLYPREVFVGGGCGGCLRGMLAPRPCPVAALKSDGPTSLPAPSPGAAVPTPHVRVTPGVKPRSGGDAHMCGGKTRLCPRAQPPSHLPAISCASPRLLSLFSPSSRSIIRLCLPI